MRIVFIGTGTVSIETAKKLIDKGHDVIIIETQKDRIDELAEEMDCSFLHGDGSQPNLLGEVNPKETDFLFCLTNSDQANVIASLVGRSLGFKRVVTTIGDPQYEGICLELGLMDTIIPSRTISRSLVDMVSGSENVQLSTILKDEARFFTLIVDKETRAARDLELPAEARVICYYRDGKFAHADEETTFAGGDEIIILTHSKNIPALQKRWKAKSTPEDTAEKTESSSESAT
jgi:trk system potassium uptake protein